MSDEDRHACRLDEATADWCFQHLGQDDENWLHRLRDEWTSSGQELQRFLSGWANGDGLHRGEKLPQLLDDSSSVAISRLARTSFPILQTRPTPRSKPQSAAD